MNTIELTLKDFNYDLPSHLIAHEPQKVRDQSKLMVRDNLCTLHKKFNDLVEILPENTLIIVNNSKVFASRLIGKLVTGGKVEIFLLNKPLSGSKARCEVLAKPMRKLQVGTQVFFEDNIVATITKKSPSEVVEPIEVEFNISSDDLLLWTNKNGYIPLPPYIERKNPQTSATSQDSQNYQTVYAETVGSVAAPTAGLHFTDELIEKLKQKNIQIFPVTLHVGAGTFMPVKHEDINEHIMHKEWHYITKQTLDEIILAKEQKRKVLAVGTTSLRALESLYRKSKSENTSLIALADQWNETNLFLRPKHKEDIYKPWIVDGLITNFHQPCSTLFMLICNLIGFDAAHEHYKNAIENEYRFFSYGDANLFWL